MKKHIVMFCILASTLATPRVHAGWFKNLAAVSIGYWGYKTTASWKSGVVHGAIAWGLCGLLQRPLRICWVQWVRKIGDPGYERIYWLMKNPFASEEAILDDIKQDYNENKFHTLDGIKEILENVAYKKKCFSSNLLEKIISTYAGDLCEDGMKDTIKKVIKNKKLFGIENPQKAEKKVEELTRTK